MKEEIWIAKTPMKRCSTSIVFREMENKIPAGESINKLWPTCSMDDYTNYPQKGTTHWCMQQHGWSSEKPCSLQEDRHEIIFSFMWNLEKVNKIYKTWTYTTRESRKVGANGWEVRGRGMGRCWSIIRWINYGELTVLYYWNAKSRS